MEKQKTRTKPFGITDRISYMFGDFGNDFTFILSSMSDNPPNYLSFIYGHISTVKFTI